MSSLQEEPNADEKYQQGDKTDLKNPKHEPYLTKQSRNVDKVGEEKPQTGTRSITTSRASFIDITLLSIGVGTKADGRTLSENESENTRMSVIIPLHTPYPAGKSRVFQATLDKKDTLNLYFYEGEKTFVKDNFKDKNKLVLRGIPKNTPLEIEITLNIRPSGRRHVTAKVTDSSTKYLLLTTSIPLETKLATPEQAKDHIKDAEEHNENAIKDRKYLKNLKRRIRRNRKKVLRNLGSL